MRVTVGVIAGLGLAIAVASAQPPSERAAGLGKPVPLQPGQTQVARGVSDNYPSTPPATYGSTPIPRSNAAPVQNAPGVASGPLWVNNTDPGPSVSPAAGTSRSGMVRQLTPQKVTSDAPTQPKFLDRFGGTGNPQPRYQPIQQVSASANSSYRSTGSNGAPVYAGPPAYRWYGWGTVTPGANPLAPTGQYPKASANWYSITGATPGAFPVPVSNDTHVMPGTEPPSYGLARSTGPTPPATQPQSQSSYQTQPQPEAPKPNVFSASRVSPGTAQGPVNVPTSTEPPIASAQPSSLPVPPAPPANLPPVPDVDAVVVPPPPAPSETSGEVSTEVPTVGPSSNGLPANNPSPLPPSVTTERTHEEPRWHTAAETPTAPPPGTWTPTQGFQPLPTQPVPQPQPQPAPQPQQQPQPQTQPQTKPQAQPQSQQSQPQWQPQWHGNNANERTFIARGQINDRTQDLVVALIKQMCEGHVDGVEIRWTGAKKLQVCFDSRNTVELPKLAGDIIKRPELSEYQIDFSAKQK